MAAAAASARCSSAWSGCAHHGRRCLSMIPQQSVRESVSGRAPTNLSPLHHPSHSLPLPRSQCAATGAPRVHHGCTIGAVTPPSTSSRVKGFLCNRCTHLFTPRASARSHSLSSSHSQVHSHSHSHSLSRSPSHSPSHSQSYSQIHRPNCSRRHIHCHSTRHAASHKTERLQLWSSIPQCTPLPPRSSPLTGTLPTSLHTPELLHPQQHQSALFSALSSRSQPVCRASAAESGGPSSGSSSKVVITTPLYYVNAAPHMGSAYPTIAADALARYHRLRGREVVFVTGTDEHGEKIALAAAACGKSPKEHTDSVAESYKELWAQMDIAYDRFIRTTNERHEALVAQFFGRCQEQGDIYRAQYEGLYCVACEEYKDEKELGEGQSCPIHLKPCDFRSEDNLFFALSKYQGQLQELFDTQPDFVRPAFRKNEVLAWVDEGVRDFSISRATVEWGIPVPGAPEQTIYVWFDALLGYMSALLEEGDPSDLDVAAAKGWPAHVHIIGKDILRFHAVYWPAMLMSAGLPTPKAVFGHGFLTKDGVKMGKSLGNTLDPQDLVQRYGSDAVRYFFLKEIEFGRDGDFSQERFVNIVNANLANTIGNLVNRTLGLLRKNCGGAIPVDTHSAFPLDHPLRARCTAAVAEAAEKYEQLDFAGGCNALLEAAAAGNVFLEERAPWSKLKKGTDEEKAAAREDLAAVLELARCVAVALSPVTPRLAGAILAQLGCTGGEGQEGVAEEVKGVVWNSALRWEDAAWGGLQEGQQTREPQPVFKRIEEEAEEVPAEKPTKGKQKQTLKA